MKLYFLNANIFVSIPVFENYPCKC